MGSPNKEFWFNERDHWISMGEAPLFEEEIIFLDKWLPNASGHENSLILEAGCGSGRISFNIERLLPDAEIFAFDFAPNMVKEAKKNARHQVSKINFFTSDIRSIPNVSDSSVDVLVYLQQVVCFVFGDDIDIALKEARRVIKSSGRMLLTALNYGGRSYNRMLSVFLRPFRFFQGDKRGKYVLPWLQPDGRKNYSFWKQGQPSVYWFTEDDIRKKLESASFNVVEIATNKQIINPDDESAGTIFYIVCEPI